MRSTSAEEGCMMMTSSKTLIHVGTSGKAVSARCFHQAQMPLLSMVVRPLPVLRRTSTGTGLLMIRRWLYSGSSACRAFTPRCCSSLHERRRRCGLSLRFRAQKRCHDHNHGLWHIVIVGGRRGKHRGRTTDTGGSPPPPPRVPRARDICTAVSTGNSGSIGIFGRKTPFYAR
jgi:hypothetical protein